ncbi:hypothetical protein [Chryseobacterium sp. BIGb0232]|uniref:hypothetical protein n=1 Tax=Chryseobacterium sp. BIGb0232 TaxID=2940598 RepID=UPI000F46FACE|nr:hypothetical protein [Chryseobacterium sp. BIGb0232]MCS4302432.1 thymidylate kinase [Chryseobacterium sp. BIGb0232]ROS18375.1 thymidylate kinase [Chryseobacterium nakagawai]
MKTLFKNTGYRLFTQQHDDRKKTTFSYILNPDGSVRWFWNSKSGKPLFLKFYNAATPKAKIFSYVVQIVFALRLQRLVFKNETVYYTEYGKPIFDIAGDWAIFTGTVGPNNKALLFADGFFYKITETETAKRLIENEFKSIEMMKTNDDIIVPATSLVNENVLKLSDISMNGIRTNEFTEFHIRALKTFSQKTQQSVKVSDWDYFQTLKRDFLEINDDRIPNNLIRKIKEVLIHNDENQTVELTFSHGDFTSWNCYVTNEKLAVYDWELSSAKRPKAFDFFHFIIQNGILIQKKSWKEIEEEIEEKNKMAFRLEDRELKKYLQFYLLTNTLSYLKVYAEQKEWHLQIHWLLQTWSQAFNLFVTDVKTERQLLIMDIFDHLSQTEYATLKFHNEAPEELEPNSDIDMVLRSKESATLIDFVLKHNLVKKVSVVKRSFMRSVRILTLQDEILNLDLISKLKWKYLQMMNTCKILKNRRQDSFGVFHASEGDTARFIDLFYNLNGAEIPEKYQSMVSDLLKGEKITNRTTEIKALKMKAYNKGFNRMINLVSYVKDSFSAKGFIITFSGVDGAGKSTVISEISELIEKRYRRPVKVLRHRPSLLPILSVWTKGKEKAHLDSINSMPRQGNNKNSFSSLLRFAYYYTDYIFGQFIIYLKYVLRGKIVLYDRYYFDFIADAKRSNIQLPKAVTESGYHLLMKPKFNFFLYAAPEKILSRKKELSYQSICELTAEYNQLFSKLQKQNNNEKYLAIENNDLDRTLGTIMNTIITEK